MRKKRRNKNKTSRFLFFIILVCCCCTYVLSMLINTSPKQEVSDTMITITPKAIVPSKAPSNTPTPVVLLSSIDELPAGNIIPKERLNIQQLNCYFTISPIDDSVKMRIFDKSYRENNDISLDELRYLKVLHYNFNHEIQVGECIVNEAISKDCIEIFTELFRNEYEIQSLYLVDEFWDGDGSSTDTASMNANNSSAFCYRVIAGTTKLSNHALGFAIDINPYQNPYITYRDGIPVYYHKDAENYADRTTTKPHMITHDDLCYQLFIQHSFTWGGDWKNSKDYQHFEKTP